MSRTAFRGAGPQHPEVEELQRQIADLRRKLDERDPVELLRSHQRARSPVPGGRLTQSLASPAPPPGASPSTGHQVCCLEGCGSRAAAPTNRGEGSS